MATSDTERRDGIIGELVSARRKAKQRILGQVVLARDEERQRIASEIHRAPLQTMKEVADALDRMRDRLEPELAAEAASLRRAVDRAAGDLREMAYELSLTPLEEEGLAGTLRALLQRMKDETGIQYRLEDRMSNDPPAQVAVTLYRIAEEALTNVRRHAGADRVDVLLESGEGHRVRVSDDGVGFRPDDSAGPPDCLGITLMHQRAKAGGGWLQLRSAPGEGTVVEFTLPSSPGEAIPSA